MNLNIFKFFQPKNRIFYLLFEKSTANTTETARALVEMVTTGSPERKRELFREIEKLEHVGDSITHETFNALKF